MANIPGISGFIQPGVFARDRVVSRGASIPGGLRIPCVMGEGLREEVIVESAAGSGADGNSDCSPTGSGDGRFFKLSQYPVTPGRTQLFLNGSQLFGTEDEIDANGFDGAYDFRVDPATGCIELQGASVGDQDGKKYSASSLNSGDGLIVDGTCGDFDLISIQDDNAPDERWTIRCISVIRDSNGDPVPGKATFTATGSVSGQLKNSSGQAYVWHSTFLDGSTGAVSGTTDPVTDGFIVAYSVDNDGYITEGFAKGAAVSDGGETADTTSLFAFSGDLVTQGQVLAGDYLCIDGTAYVIESIDYDSDVDETTITLEDDVLDSSLTDQVWEIRATNVFIEDTDVAHDPVTGDPDTAGSFTSAEVGKVLMLCDGDAAGLYTITAVTSSQRVRVVSFEDSSSSLPDLDGIAGIGASSITWKLLESNGVLLFAIQEGSSPFKVGDKFFIDVNSKILKRGDKLEAKYIAEADLNDPEYFVSAQELFTKHGTPSVTNTLSLGAQMAFENGAPGVFAIQCKPAIPRRTSVTLVEEVDDDGDGGFGGCTSDCEVDDLLFVIPRPISGLLSGRPDADTGVNLFVIRDGEETQVFPNKVSFYNSQLETAAGQADFISSNDYAFSYTVINTDTKVIGQGISGILAYSNSSFTSTEVDFDAADVGSIIVVQKLETTNDESSSQTLTSISDISDHIFDPGTLATASVELIITEIVNDNTVIVASNTDEDAPIAANAFDVQFYIKDESDTTNVSTALLLHRDLASSGVIQEGDGIKISYIDETDADFFDTNWFNAFEQLEAIDFQILVPLPTQNRFGIFRSAVSHCENMSSIANKKERLAFIGAQIGVTANAMIGNEELAVEDVGLIEGVQGDDPEEVLDGNIEDLVNLKLSDNYTSNRCVYFYPDEIIRNINGTNTAIDGFYMAAAAAGYLSGVQNVAVPLTYKTLVGFSLQRNKIFRKTILDALGNVGATVVQPVTGGGKVLAGRTTSNTSLVEDEEISVMFIRDRVKQVLRDSLVGFIGTVEDANTQGVMTAKVRTVMNGLLSQGLITDFRNVKVERDKVDPRQWNVFLRFTPSYPINFVWIDLEVGVL